MGLVPCNFVLEVVMGRLRSNVWSWVFIVSLSVFMGFFLILQSAGAGYYEKKLLNTDAYTTMELESVLESYQIKAMVLDAQIVEIKKETNWLILKINRIQDAGEKPPRNLMESVRAKEEKSTILHKEKIRLETLSSHYLKELDSRKKIESDNMQTAIQKKAPESIAIQKISPEISKPIMDKSNTIKKSQIEAAVKKADLEDWVAVNGDDTCLRIETTLPILFSSGSAKVSKEYQSFFKKLASFLKPYDVKVLVNGYADTLPINTKQYPSNFELGATRAANIIHELVKQGLKPSIFKIETTGEYRFAAKGPSQQKSFERRAQVTVIFTG